MSHISLVKGPKPHTHSVWLYWAVFGALVILTGLTVALAQFDFGKLNLFVTLLIAGTKSCLVMGIFMHLAFDNKFFSVIAGTSFLFLALFIIFPILDMNSRPDVDASRNNYLPRDEQVHKHATDKPEALPLRPGLQEAKPEQLIFIKANEH